MAKAKKQKLQTEEPPVENPIEETTPVAEEVPAEVPVEEPVVKEVQKPVKEHPSYAVMNNTNLSMEERIAAYMDSRESGVIRLNDFLKSLYGVPPAHEPPKWASQSGSKQLKVVLDKMNREGLIVMADNNYLKLGTCHYPDMTTGKTEFHNLNTVNVMAKK